MITLREELSKMGKDGAGKGLNKAGGSDTTNLAQSERQVGLTSRDPNRRPRLSRTTWALTEPLKH